MRRVQTGPLVGLAGVLAALASLDLLVGLRALGWAAGLGAGVGVSALLAAALARRSARALGPADLITLLRAVLVCACAALVAGGDATGVLVGLATVALVLDGVDGWVARRTGTVSELGARFDMEVDAFLILVLSVAVGPTVGWWVLLIGGARYAFVAGGRLLPWLRGNAPARPWCKVVAVVQGVTLTVGAAGILPVAVGRVLVLVALALLAESFGREAWELWRLRERTAQHRPAAIRELVDHA